MLGEGRFVKTTDFGNRISPPYSTQNDIFRRKPQSAEAAVSSAANKT